MFIIKVIATFVCLFTAHSFVYAFNAQDTSITESQKTNMAFNGIYRQNVSTGFFGNEYGNKIRSTLVADLNPNVILLNSKISRFFILFSPRVKLRLLNAFKSPVRSPSYMPGAKVYFYTLDYTIGKRKVSSALLKSNYGSLGIELHTGLFNKGYSKELDNNYGFIRLNGSWIYDLLKDKSGSDKYTSHQRLQARFTYITDKYENYALSNLRKRLNASVQYNYQFGFMDNVAMGLGVGYRGQG